MQQCSRHSTMCWLLVLGCVWAVACQLRPVMAKPSPDPDQMAAMADALKYLQDLDRYYSQVARPSPRSEAGMGHQHELSKVASAIKMLQLQELDRLYSQRTRPRFGKRSELRPLPEELASIEDRDSERLWRQYPQG